MACPQKQIASETRQAQARIAGMVDATPLIEDKHLGRQLNARVFLKPECLQKTGSFKVRGAFNKILSHKDQITEAGVVAWSSGNHGIAVSFVAKMLGVKATIVVPRDAPRTKLSAIADLGADVILYDRQHENREEIGRSYSDRTGALVIPAYDDPWIIAGQGTVGEELLDQCRDIGSPPDFVVVPCGGGGLTAGITVPFQREQLATKIYAVEPEGYDDTQRSLDCGVHCSNNISHASLCDSLMTPTPGKLTFAINRERLSGALVVSDAEVLAAISYAYRDLDLTLEPGGAAGLAALLAGKLEVENKIVVVVLSGSNIDKPILSLALGLPAMTVKHHSM